MPACVTHCIQQIAALRRSTPNRSANCSLSGCHVLHHQICHCEEGQRPDVAIRSLWKRWGLRIPTPVCGLARNDKEGRILTPLRPQERFERNRRRRLFARDVAHWLGMTSFVVRWSSERQTAICRSFPFFGPVRGICACFFDTVALYYS